MSKKQQGLNIVYIHPISINVYVDIFIFYQMDTLETSVALNIFGRCNDNNIPLQRRHTIIEDTATYTVILSVQYYINVIYNI